MGLLPLLLLCQLSPQQLQHRLQDTAWQLDLQHQHRAASLRLLPLLLLLHHRLLRGPGVGLMR